MRPRRRRWRRDHPRSRGVYAACVATASRQWGSSPLARGLRTTCSTPSSSTPDHPRSRGVYAKNSCGSTPRPGSSPLARGLRSIPRDPGDRIGIIPARAGFTPGSCRRRLRDGDHPRSRGVYGGTSCAARTAPGSSPLARGLRRGRCCVPRPHGDHPRSRGVYVPALIVGYPREGSSPLARGLPTARPVPATSSRIIPARAGFTRWRGA